METKKILSVSFIPILLIVFSLIFSGNNLYAQKCVRHFGDKVWEDNNGNGFQDAGENGIHGVKIVAKINGNYFDEVYSETDGEYQITYCNSGNYTIEVDMTTVPSYYSATTSLIYSKNITGGSSNFNDFDFGFRDLNNCTITKANGGGFFTTISSVINNGGSYTVVLTIEHNGCPGGGQQGCKELSHYSVEADKNTYSNVAVTVIEGDMEYDGIDMGWNLGGDPFNGFKIDETEDIGDGNAGVFTITYTIDYLQDQQTSAKAGNNSQIASFTIAEFQQVYNCTSNNPPVAVDDSYTTPINTEVSGNVIANDNDPDGDDITVNTPLITDPSHGSVVQNTDGTFTYTPNTGYTGTDSYVYKICDDGTPSKCDQATVTINITTGNDSDGDGCTDDVDDYPTDPTRCLDNYYPANGYGTLAYEDLWPAKGDYDFNDLVCDYKFQMVTNSSNNIVEVFGTFIIKAFGAGFENGFGFQLANDNIFNSDISVTGYDLQEGYITLNGNGTEAGQSIPTIIVYDNSFNLMPHPGQGIGVNTDPPAPYVIPDTISVYMDITDNIYTLAQLDIPNFNPFIIVNLERGVEVHLPNYEPTDLVDESYFGTFEDDSDLSIDRYYKTENNLPWAINIYESFEYPEERVEIIATYLHFVEWAESGGTLFTDWYNNTDPGYRNEANIYVIP